MNPSSLLIVAGMILSGCTMTKTMEPSAAGCAADKASAFVGRKADDAVAEQARLAAGAKLVRVLAPDTIVTMEFLAWRLNLNVDANGVVQSVRCG